MQGSEYLFSLSPLPLKLVPAFWGVGLKYMLQLMLMVQDRSLVEGTTLLGCRMKLIHNWLVNCGQIVPWSLPCKKPLPIPSSSGY